MGADLSQRQDAGRGLTDLHQRLIAEQFPELAPVQATYLGEGCDSTAVDVLCDPETGRPTGVIDWSDMALGDPAVDFAALFHAGGDRFAKAVLANYDGQVDEHGLARARFLAACRGVGDVRFGLDMNRREYVAAGLRALELCAH